MMAWLAPRRLFKFDVKVAHVLDDPVSTEEHTAHLDNSDSLQVTLVLVFRDLIVLLTWVDSEPATLIV